MKKEKDDLVHVRYGTGSYVARWRGHTAYCAAGSVNAAVAVVRKVMKRTCSVGLYVKECEGDGRQYEFSIAFISGGTGEVQGNQFDETIMDELSTQVPV